tara:strand:- start:775 stop:1182 length:408 start_codon:yes stop_codon:yes gene_type:complete
MALTKEIMDLMVVFENLTNVHVKDCFENNGKLVFLVLDVNVLKAIGKEGANIRRLEGVFKKRIKIVGYSKDVCQFVKSFISPIKVDSIELEEGKVVISVGDVKSKGLLIGRSRRNLNNLEEVIDRYFKGVKVEIR